MALLTAALVWAVGISAPLATYFIARRRTRGRIDTTEAATLWTEAEAMRHELRADVVALREELMRRPGRDRLPAGAGGRLADRPGGPMTEPDAVERSDELDRRILAIPADKVPRRWVVDACFMVLFVVALVDTAILWLAVRHLSHQVSNLRRPACWH